MIPLLISNPNCLVYLPMINKQKLFLKFRMYSPCTHVIFDMDGLLINTEDLYTDAFQAVLDEFDVKYTFEMKAQIMG